MPTHPLHLESLGSPQSSAMAPSWIDLPGKKEPRPLLSGTEPVPGPEEPRAATQLDGLELTVGRIAIFGATGILVKELLTGESILDQCGDVLNRCLS